jgi:nitrogen fixation/metabolism regulation signal transduction histidine kinase
VSLRAKIVLYFALVHLVLAGVALVWLREHRAWLLAVELVLAASIVAGVRLVRALFVPLQLIRSGTDLITERDFGTHFREVGQPEMDALIGVYNRMVDRLRDERVKLEERQLFLERVIDASPSGILILDVAGRVEHVNPRLGELLAGEGVAASAQAWTGRRLDEIPGTLPAALRGLEVGEARVIVQRGRRRLRCTRAEFLDQGFRRSFFLVDEVTRELRASERAAYDKLIRTMSHEVKNSVGAVASLMDSCRAYAARLGGEERTDFLHALEVSIARMRNLDAFVNAFADVVRIPPPQRRPAELKQVVDRIVALLRAELDRRRIGCEWEVAERVPPVALDAGQLEQALVNVLKNAAEAIGEGGRIRLRLERANGRTRLSITDDGPGLTAEARAGLFTPFFTTKKDGRGLGLTLVQEILAQHRFEFGLEPAVPRGTCFWVEI